MENKKHFRQFFENELYQTMVGSMRVDQVKEIILSLDESVHLSDFGKKGSEDVLEMLSVCKGDDSQKIEAMFKAEIVEPYKHGYLAFIDNFTDESFNFSSDVYEFENEKIKKLYFLYKDESKLKDSGRINFLFEYRKPISKLIEISRDNYKKEHYVKRHPIVLSFNLEKKYLSVLFPGVEGGGSKYATGGVVYENLISCILELVKNNLDVVVSTFNLKKIIQSFHNKKNERFSVQMLNSSHNNVDLRLASNNKSTDNHAVIVEMAKSLSSYLDVDEKIVLTGLKQFFKDATVDEAIIGWNKERATTKLRFLSSGPEIIFAWFKPFYKTYHSQFTILDSLANLCQSALMPDREGMWTYLNELDSGTVITPLDLSQRFNCDDKTIKSVVQTFLEIKKIIPVYKLKYNGVIDGLNNQVWHENLVDFNKVFVDEDGNEISGRDFSNILIAFKKIGEEL